jgi:hypothetical protein
MTLIEFVKLDHSLDIPLYDERIPPPRRVGSRMAQASVNVPDDGEKVTPDLKLVVMEETRKVLEGVQLKVLILYVNFIERCRNVRGLPGF